MNHTATFDQASGLRELFTAMPTPDASNAGPQAPIMALVCPTRPALALPMAQSCSHQLSQLQLRHAWVDELDFDLREEWPMPCPVRFDLGQTLANHVPLASALQAFDAQIGWYASARRLSAMSPRVMPLAERLVQSGLDFDGIMVCAQPDQVRPWWLYGDQVRPIILCEATSQAASRTLDWVQREQAKKDGLDLPRAAWVLLGAAGDEQTAARAAVDSRWKALWGQPPDWSAHAALQPGQGLASLLTQWQAPAASLIRHLGLC